MLKRVGKYMGYVALWLVLWLIISWAKSGLERHRTEQEVTAFDIRVKAAGDVVMLGDDSIEEWVAEHDVNPLGRSLAEVDLGALEHAVGMYHAVGSVNAYVTYDGRVSLDVEQRTPRARLRLDGYDMYVMADGYIFPAEDVHPVYVPVITGDYRPIFTSHYVGYVGELVSDSIASLEHRIASLEQQKIPHHNLRQRCNEELRKTVNRSVRRGLFMSGYEYDRRCEELKLVKEQARRDNIEENKRIDAEIAALTAQQQDERRQQKKLEKIADDFRKLTNFVEIVSNDAFWRSEIVQIVLSEGYDGAMQLGVVPRSGGFLIDFGYMDRLEEKLRDLALFYEQGLRNMGWTKYSHISLRYADQIVCK